MKIRMQVGRTGKKGRDVVEKCDAGGILAHVWLMKVGRVIFLFDG